MTDPVFFDCAHFTVPTVNNECSEVFWSEYKSCYRCPKKDCYRNGWKKAQVREDHEKMYNIKSRRKAA